MNIPNRVLRIRFVNFHRHPLSRFHIDPSGTYDKYKAKAIGAGSEAAMTALQDGYDEVGGWGGGEKKTFQRRREELRVIKS